MDAKGQLAGNGTLLMPSAFDAYFVYSSPGLLDTVMIKTDRYSRLLRTHILAGETDNN